MYLRKRGWGIIPIYEKDMKAMKGPRVFPRIGLDSIIAPDMQAYKDDKVCWIEAKRKSCFAWNYTHKAWVTGIDKKYFSHYQEIEKETPWKVWIFFDHLEKAQPKGTPEGKESPYGMFYHSLKHLSENIHHTSEKWGSLGMVYWHHDTLLKCP